MLNLSLTLTIATNIPVLLMFVFLAQAHIYVANNVLYLIMNAEFSYLGELSL